MTTELEFTKLEDPFHDSSSLSLIPKTLADRSGSSRLDTAENLFESLVARGSPKIMQEAQIISNSVSAIDSLYKENETTDASCKTRGQERRPALGRKRAKFSIKPDVPSYSESDTKVSLSSIDNIDDPDEYFKAFEQMQNAEMEIQKLRGGVLTDVTQQDHDQKPRQRRPGLLGKRASYKHHISQDDAMAETLAKIQEKHHMALNYSSSLIDSELVDGTKSQTNNSNSKPQEPELEDPVAERENNELDYLLSSYKDLAEGEDETYMREILHLKPIDVCKINLPALPNCAIHAVSELPKKLSPSIKSPLVSVSTFLKKRLSITNLQNNILSFPEEDAADSPDSSSSKSARSSPVVELDSVVEPSQNTNPLPDKSTSPKSIGARNKKHKVLDDSDGGLQGDNVHHGTLVFDESEAGVRPHDSQPNTHEVLEDASHLFGVTTKADSNGGNYSNEVQITNEPTVRDEILVPNASEISNSGTINDMPPSEVDVNLQVPDVRNFQEESCPADTNQDRENQHESSTNSTKEHSLVPPTNEVRKRKAPKRSGNKRKYSRKQNAAGNSHPPEAMDISNQPSENQQLPDTNNEDQIASQTPSNELVTQKAPPRPRKRKMDTKRQSLADAGTLWVDGRRKSSRQKFRPLEHWRGERLLFGRIHDSLATVIGVKYASPGKTSLKVESYVSAEFADLLNIASKG